MDAGAGRANFGINWIDACSGTKAIHLLLWCSKRYSDGYSLLRVGTGWCRTGANTWVFYLCNIYRVDWMYLPASSSIGDGELSGAVRERGGVGRNRKFDGANSRDRIDFIRRYSGKVHRPRLYLWWALSGDAFPLCVSFADGYMGFFHEESCGSEPSSNVYWYQ
jgi:hypothetical protein